ncbi:MAG: SoxR reducing system RseC family protein [Paludibacteraceae bacterium]|nr:SoxR reducing system RseC family protein [Paludibacteraceae bacterium]
MLHSGTVTGKKGNVLSIDIIRQEACAHCNASSACRVLNGKHNCLEIECKNASDFNIGDIVTVEISESTGHKAVFIAYVLPLILLVIALATAILCGVSEAVAALIALCVTIFYYLIIYFFRNKIKESKRFEFRVKGQGSRMYDV